MSCLNLIHPTLSSVFCTSLRHNKRQSLFANTTRGSRDTVIEPKCHWIQQHGAKMNCSSVNRRIIKPCKSTRTWPPSTLHNRCWTFGLIAGRMLMQLWCYEQSIYLSHLCAERLQIWHFWRTLQTSEFAGSILKNCQYLASFVFSHLLGVLYFCREGKRRRGEKPKPG